MYGTFSQKFYFNFLEGIIKKISYDRRDYESVDEKSLFWLCPEKLRKEEFVQ